VLTSLNGGFDPWPYIPMLRAITSYQEYSGDTSVIPFMTRFFGYLSSQPTLADQQRLGLHAVGRDDRLRYLAVQPDG
jgi:hypothetical protein